MKYLNRKSIHILMIAGTLISLACAGCVNQVNYPKYDPETITSDLNSIAMDPKIKDTYEHDDMYIEKYDIDAHIVGTYVQTAIDLTVRNPYDGNSRAELEFQIPAEAMLTGYAIDVDNMEIPHQMVDAVVVDNDESKYDKSYQRYQKDNTTSSMIGPLRSVTIDRIHRITPRGFRQIRIEYTMPLHLNDDGTSSVILPMVKSELLERNVHIAIDIPGLKNPLQQGLGEEKFKRLDNTWILEKTDKHIIPQSNLLISLPQLPDVVTSVENYIKDSSETFFAINLRTDVTVPNPKTQDLSHLRIIWDASGNRKPMDIQQARKMLELIPDSGYYEVYLLRNEIDSPAILNNRAEVLKYIDGVDYDGGTNFASLQSIADTDFEGMTLIFTDGVDTYMNTMNTMPEFGYRSAAVLSGNVYDIHAMMRICGGNAYHLNDLSPEEIYKQLQNPKPKVSVVNGKHISDIEGIGDPDTGRISIIGKLNGDSDTVNIKLTDGREYSVPIAAKNTPSGRILAVSWATARVYEIASFSKRNRRELNELARKYTIIVPNTEFRILASTNDWLEYDIEPPEKYGIIHERWIENEQNYYNALKNQIAKKWDERVEWWNHPIPPNLATHYRCTDDTLTDCKELIISDLAEHYSKPFTPPDGWKCTEDNQCNIISSDYNRVIVDAWPPGPILSLTSSASPFFPFYNEEDDGEDDIQTEWDNEDVEDDDVQTKWDPETPWLNTRKIWKIMVRMQKNYMLNICVCAKYITLLWGFIRMWVTISLN